MTERKETGSLVAVLYCEDCDRVIMHTAVSGKNRDRFYPDQLTFIAEQAHDHNRRFGKHTFILKWK